MRGRRADGSGVVRQLYVQAAVLIVSGLAAGPLQAAGPLGGNASSQEFLVVLNPNVSQEAANQALAAADFGPIEAIPGLPPRFRQYGLLKVTSTDAATKSRLLGVSGVRAVRPIYRNPRFDYPLLSNGQIIVRFKPGVTLAQVRTIAEQNRCTIARQIRGLSQVYVLDVDEREQDAYGCAVAIARDTNVVYCHPSMLFKLDAHQTGIIEDPLYPYQWHLNNTGQLPGGRSGADIEAELAWNTTLGSGALVAVIDECIQRDHEDLAPNYVTGFDFFDQDDDPSPMYGPSDWSFDPIGEAHGTAVAGLICAAANTLGVRGVAPEAGLIGCKVSLGPGFILDQDVADAFLFAEASGAMAINNSWGWHYPLGRSTDLILPTVPGSFLFPDVITDAINQIATNGRGGRGVLVLFSSGNDAVPIPFDNIYATLPTVMAVGATLRDDTLTCYSSFGPQQSVVAPGGGFTYLADQPHPLILGVPMQEICFEPDMATTDNMEVPGQQLIGKYMGMPYPGWPIRGYNPAMKFLDVADPAFCPPGDPYPEYGCYPLVPDNYALPDFPDPNYTRRFNGTSSACPVATGVAALVFSVDPTLTAEQVRNILEHTADKPTYLNEAFDAVTGHNDRYGHGRVNARKAVQAAMAGKSWPSPVKDVQNVSSQALARLMWTNPVTDVVSVLVVRSSSGRLDWAPQDGVDYAVGQQVAPGTVVVANSLIDMLDQTGLPKGPYEFGIYTRDSAGFYSWGRRASFTSEGAVTPPLASLSASPTTGMAPLAVHFAGGAIDPSGLKNLSFSWDFGDGTTAFGATIDHTYMQPGNYLATLRVTNNYGQSAETTVRISVLSEYNLPPQATIQADPVSGTAPLVVTFEAVASDQDGVVVHYLWDFGDNQTAAGQRVEHTYINAGTYGVKLTVTDDQGGTATDAALITVLSSSATAARTEPAGALGAMPCGSGAPLAVVGAALGLIGLLSFRRR